MNVRVEVRFHQSWDQPVIVVHPDPDTAEKLAKVCVDAIRNALDLPARATIGDDPGGKWGEGTVVYER